MCHVNNVLTQNTKQARTLGARAWGIPSPPVVKGSKRWGVRSGTWGKLNPHEQTCTTSIVRGATQEGASVRGGLGTGGLYIAGVAEH